MGASFRFFNTTDAPVQLAIEPWADAVEVPVGGNVDFQLEGDNSAIESSWSDSGPLVFAWADVVTISAGEHTVVWRIPDGFSGKTPPTPWHVPSGLGRVFE
jgi:hypothetical protein